MIFVIGGRAQGKKAWAKEHCPDAHMLVIDDWARTEFMRLYESEKWKQDRSLNQDLPEMLADLLWSQLQDRLAKMDGEILLISCEIGNGIVPMDAAERTWREGLGRLQIRIARESETVVRVCCGIGMRIKG